MRRVAIIVFTLLTGTGLAWLLLSMVPDRGELDAAWTGKTVVQQDVPAQTSDAREPILKTDRENAISTSVVKKTLTIVARPIEPGVVAPPPVTGSFERTEPRAPLGDIALAKPPPAAAKDPGSWKPMLLHRPLIRATGELESGGYLVRIGGVTPPGLSMTCQDGEEQPVPCGMMARTAFRNWVRSRALTCRVPPKPVESGIETWCTLAGKDVALWLAENGWIVSASAQEASMALAKAKQERRGLYEFATGLTNQ